MSKASLQTHRHPCQLQMHPHTCHTKSHVMLKIINNILDADDESEDQSSSFLNLNISLVLSKIFTVRKNMSHKIYNILREGIMSYIIDSMLIQKLLRDHPWGIFNHLVHPSATSWTVWFRSQWILSIENKHQRYCNPDRLDHLDHGSRAPRLSDDSGSSLRA